MDDLQHVLEGMFPGGRSCRKCLDQCGIMPNPGEFAAPPHGPLDGRPIDILLVSWNPQIKRYDKPPPPDFNAWVADGEGNRENARVFFSKHFSSKGQRILDPSRLRIVNTRVWKWPGTDKLEADRATAEFCAATHLWEEIIALRPRVVVTADKHAAPFVHNKLVSSGRSVRPPPRNAPKVRGWVEPDVARQRPGYILADGNQARLTAERVWVQERCVEWLARSKP